MDPKKGEPCPIFRAQYERKKKYTQYERYEQAKDQAVMKESSELTEKQIEEMLMPHLDELISDRTGKISTAKLRLYLRKYEKVRISTWKAYQIKGNIEAQHPEKFEEL